MENGFVLRLVWKKTDDLLSRGFCSRQLRSDGPDNLRVARHRLLQGVVLGLTGYNCSKLTPATQAVTLKPG
jgi:hypothetical protein